MLARRFSPVIAATWRHVILTGVVGAQRVYFVTLLLPVRVPQSDSPSPNPVFLRPFFSYQVRRTIALLISSDGRINRDRWLFLLFILFSSGVLRVESIVSESLFCIPFVRN